MATKYHDEIDLGYVVEKTKGMINNGLSLVYKFILFCLKFWWIILLLIVIGFGYGYYKKSQMVSLKVSSVIVKVNYDLQPYVMNAMETFNSKVIVKDSAFLTSAGFDIYDPAVKNVTAMPVVDYKDILDKYQINERSLDMLLKYIEFKDEDEITLQDILETEYDFYKFTFKVNPGTSEAQISKFFEYINSEKKLSEYKAEAEKNMRLEISENEKSIALINDIYESYVVEPTLGANSVGQIDKGFDLNSLMESKLIIQDRNKILKNEMVLSDNIIVPLHSAYSKNAEEGILSKLYLVYPVLLVLLFLLIALARYLFVSLKKAVEPRG